MSDATNYLTIKEAGSNELIIKKSRFIASLARTTNVEEAEDFIKHINKQYRDATHNTFAYTIGLNDDQVKASDNGEPSETAGVPELKALQLMNLKNVTVVVTRYFGGIKLGAGGLIRAYSNSVTSGVQAIGVVRRVLQQELKFHLAYKQFDEVDHYLKQQQIVQGQIDYGVDITMSVWTDIKEQAALEAALTNLLNGQVTFTVGEERYNELQVADTNYHEQ